MPLADIAREFAAEIHADQLDKQGRPYFDYHLAPVARMARSLALAAGSPYSEQADFIEAVAWLHDAIEDHAVTHEAFYQRGIGAVAAPVRWLTHDKDVPYQHYIVMIADNAPDAALAVKLADNLVNASTLDALPPATRDRLTIKYAAAVRLLLPAFVRRAHPESLTP